MSCFVFSFSDWLYKQNQYLKYIWGDTFHVGQGYDENYGWLKKMIYKP